MGYRGKLEERARARELRAQAWTLREIADHLGVSKSSVSVWVRDVAFDPSARTSSLTSRRPRRTEHPLRRRKLARIAELDRWGRRRLASLSERSLLVAGTALYAGDGSKSDGQVRFANSNPELVRFFCTWLRYFFEVDEGRLRVYLYLHQGLDLDAAIGHWAEVTGVPEGQFGRAYRAVPDASIRTTKHRFGCASVSYGCSDTQRAIMGLVRALPETRWPSVAASDLPRRRPSVQELRGPGSNRRHLG